MSSSSLSFKETCTKTGRCEQAVFDKVKRVLFTQPLGDFNQVCYRHFMKTLNSGSNVSKKQTGFLRHYVAPPIFIFRFVFPQHLIDLNRSFLNLPYLRTCVLKFSSNITMLMITFVNSTITKSTSPANYSSTTMS